MLKLNPNPTFTAPVQISVPGQDATEIIRVTFRHKTVEGLAAWYQERANKPARDALDEVIESWDGPLGADGEKVAYSREALGNLLNGYPAAASEFVRAYMRELTESRVKN